MIEELREKIVDKWNDMSIKTKLIGAAIIVVIVVSIIVG
jgi:flagellar biosynthesis/type III secretory pathway M-ring protein FliF/YscJ|tara:strand:- start:287 stop:403 length:117 start_codon:yes stop_codon:yes gene_type:complete